MTTQTPQPDTAALEHKIDALQSQIALLLQHQRKQQEMIDELMPISREVMRAMTHQLADLESRGYFTFGKASLQILDRVITSYEPKDLEELGDNIITILDTVRSATRPEILQIAHEAAEALRNADDNEPMSPWGVWKAASNDKNVRHGVAVLVSLLRHLGRASRRLSHEDKLDKIAPRRIAAPRDTAPRASAAPRAANAPVLQAVSVPSTDPDPEAWTREAAIAMAAQLGMTLTPNHWTLIEFARAEFQQTGAAPNVRRLGKGSGLSVRDVYQAFPNAPGVTIALLAGIPKPKGCI